MADSLWKDLCDLLAAGTWTNHGATPGVIQVTAGIQSLYNLAVANQSNSACIIVLPPTWEPTHTHGVRGKTYRFDVAVFRFPASVGTDQDQDKLAALITDLDAVLLAGSLTGVDEVYQESGQNLTNKKYARMDTAGRHLFASTQIIAEDWVA